MASESQHVLVLGAGGRLGAALTRGLAEAGHEVVGLGRAEADFSRPDELLQTVLAQEFDVLINCAAITSVDYCEDAGVGKEVFLVNASAPGMLAMFCAERGARMIHVSTDYVFDGQQEGPLTEEHPAHPLGVYGESKRAGEELVLERGKDQHLVVRVSWVFGPDRPSFLDSMMRKALAGERVAAIADKWSNPGYSLDYADWFGAILRHPELTGILHLCNDGGTHGATWQEYAQWGIDCALEAGWDMKTKTVEPQELAHAHFFKAPRPVNTVMSTEKFTNITGIKPRDWKEAVKAYVEQFPEAIRG